MFSYQNLNTTRGELVKGSILRKGRAWLRLLKNKKKDSYRLSFHWEWLLWSNHIGVDFRIGCGDTDRDLTLFLGCGLFAFWFTFENMLPSAVMQWGRKKALNTPYLGYEYMAWPRNIGVSMHMGSLWFSIWNSGGHWSSKQPRWMAFNFNFIDFIFGRPIHASRLIDKDTQSLSMPEAAYLVQIEIKQETWRRPRWPFPKQIVRAHMDCDPGVPLPGKGYLSGKEDAVYSLTCPASSFNEALSCLYKSVMKTRVRRGGKNWTPEVHV